MQYTNMVSYGAMAIAMLICYCAATTVFHVVCRLRQLFSDHKREELQAELAKYKNTTELTAHLKKVRLDSLCHMMIT